MIDAQTPIEELRTRVGWGLLTLLDRLEEIHAATGLDDAGTAWLQGQLRGWSADTRAIAARRPADADLAEAATLLASVHELLQETEGADLQKLARRIDAEHGDELRRLANRLYPPGSDDPERDGSPVTPTRVDAEQWVTLLQMAELAHVCKKTLERALREKKLPDPDVEGGGGKSHLWCWSRIRGPLGEISRRPLPERFPELLPLL